MSFLKRLPIAYTGELHDVRLVNFSVAFDELEGKVPQGIKARNINGRAHISMVDVKLKNMHPSFVPGILNFNYRHIAFRLLVDDQARNKGIFKGIYFLRSFTDSILIAKAGNLMTNYNLSVASIKESNGRVVLSQDRQIVAYSLGEAIIHEDENVLELKHMTQTLDRAYSSAGKSCLNVTLIQREKWPVMSVACYDYQNTFFDSARLEGAFRVFETIYYQWSAPKTITI